jgi:hypothetical protein
MAGRRDGRWRLHLDGFPEVTTDELTLDEVETAERVCGVPYVLLNPHASAKEAKALLVLLMMRGGVPEKDALKAAGKLPLKTLAGAFVYEFPDELPATLAAEAPDPPSSGPTSAPG